MIVATRMLRVRTGDPLAGVPVRVFAPEPEGAAWVCRYEIGWPEGVRASAAYGFDGTQALVLGLQKIGIELYTSEAHETGALMWEAPGQGYGFPVPVNARDLLVGEDRRFEA